MKYYIAYEKTPDFSLKDASVVYQADELGEVEEVIEERGVEAVIYEYDVVPNDEYIDGRLVLHELLLENEKLVVN